MLYTHAYNKCLYILKESDRLQSLDVHIFLFVESGKKIAYMYASFFFLLQVLQNSLRVERSVFDTFCSFFFLLPYRACFIKFGTYFLSLLCIFFITLKNDLGCIFNVFFYERSRILMLHTLKGIKSSITRDACQIFFLFIAHPQIWYQVLFKFVAMMY